MERSLIMCKFSILILSIPERLKKLTSLYKTLEDQIKKSGWTGEVEVLVLLDNKIKTIAEKRNILLSTASGEFLTFLDDDDKVDENYVSHIVKAIVDNPLVDVITFNQECLINGIPLKVVFGLGNPHDGLTYDEKQGCYKDINRPPYHICVWRAIVAKSEVFNNVRAENGQSIEDIDWCLRLYPKCNSSYHIDKTLHYYLYSSETTQSMK